MVERRSSIEEGVCDGNVIIYLGRELANDEKVNGGGVSGNCLYKQTISLHNK